MGGGTVFVVRLSRAGRGPLGGYVLPEPITMADIGDALVDNPWESLSEMESWLADHGLVQRCADAPADAPAVCPAHSVAPLE